MIKKRILLALSLIGLYACSTTRYVTDGEFLLSRVDIQVDSLADSLGIEKSSLESYLGQRPNRRLFGAIPLNLWIYNLNNKTSNSWLNRRLRTWGEEPQIYNNDDAHYTANRLSTYFYNKGFLNAQTEIQLDTLDSKHIAVGYQVKLGELYQISQHKTRVQSPEIAQILQPKDSLLAKANYPDERYTPYVQAGEALSSDNMQKERIRMAQILRNRGYYQFKEEDVYFRVDTLAGAKDVWVETMLDSLYQPYRIGKISFLQNIKSPEEASRTRQYQGISFYAKDNKWVKANILARKLLFKEGDLYSATQTARSYAALMDLKTHSAVRIKYSRDTLNPEPLLNCEISTMMNPNKEFMMELVGTHSSGNYGVNTAFGVKHNNLFHGSEEFNALFRIGYEDFQYKNQLGGISYGVESSLKLPRIILPLFYKKKQLNTQGTTDISLMYDYRSDYEFKRKLFSLNYGYNWYHYQSPHLKHKLQIAEIDYLNFDYINEDFYRNMPDITRMLFYRNQFVLGASYTFRYNSSQKPSQRPQKNLHNLRLYLQSAGNLLRAYSSYMLLEQDKYGAYKFLGINYAQFFRGELDYSGLYRLDKRTAIAAHLSLQAIVPYGNSRILPIDLRYFTGGANSMRGWNLRELGPGSMKADNKIFFQMGDIKLDMSLEYRKRITSAFELASFIDAGNIWTIYPYENQKNANFELNRFYKEIALSTGLGLRWDLDYVLLRLDTGFKLYNPQEDLGRRWVFTHQYLKDLIAIHFALGYPF